MKARHFEHLWEKAEQTNALPPEECLLKIEGLLQNYKSNVLANNPQSTVAHTLMGHILFYMAGLSADAKINVYRALHDSIEYAQLAKKLLDENSNS